MARGRFISKAIATDRAVNNLSSDTCRLAFTWLITIADREGRAVGEPELLKAALFPRRSDITPEQIEVFISEWMTAKFIIWYYGEDGDRYIQFVNFEKHQSGLRKDREAASEIEAPDNCRTVDGLTPEEIGLRLSKDKGKGKEEGVTGGDNDFSILSKAYGSNIGVLSSDLSDMLQDDLNEYGVEMCVEAIREAVRNNVRKWAYVQGILKRWKVDGKITIGKTKKEAKVTQGKEKGFYA